MFTPSVLTRLCTTAVCSTLLLAAAVHAAPSSNLIERPLDRAVNNELNLTHSWNSELRISPAPEQTIRVSIPIDNMSYTLKLEPYSIRAEEYQVLMQNDDGELYEVHAGPVRTLRGSIEELGGSVVAGSLMEDGLYARIRLENGEEIWMEPVGEKLNLAASNVYAFYRTDDIIPSGGTCAADDHMSVANILRMQANYESRIANRGTIICTAQLGVDTDYEYYQDWGSQTESRINQVINSVNIQYEDDVQLSHEITTIIVRSSSNDPYNSSNAETMLDEFGNEWNSNQGNISRDVAHLFTGKNTGSTIGIAWLGVVCYTSSAYSLVQSDCCGSFGCATDLSAHELGHNWGAGHVSSPAYNTMYPSIQCANLFVQSSIDAITSYANSSSCLDCANQAPQGACCISGSQCLFTWEVNCNAGGGTWMGNGTTCDNGICADPEGACCIGGSCLIYTELDCASAGGVYAGDGSNCSNTGCTEGACCIDTTCSITLQIDCAGNWYGDNTNCVDVTCGAGTDQLNYELRTWSRSDGQVMETYDIYFPSTDPNTKMVSVFGQDADLLEIQAWSNANFDGTASQISLYQHQIDSDLAHDRSLDDLIGIDLQYDSYVTVGSDDSVIGLPLVLGFDSSGFNSSAGVEMDNGVWFVTPDDPLALIGSGTVEGHRVASLSVESGQGLDLMINVQWFDGMEVVHETRNIYWNNLGLGGGSDCPTDIDGNGTTNVSDVLALIAEWGPCNGCSGDLDGNGTINVSDLLEVIAAWGACP